MQASLFDDDTEPARPEPSKPGKVKSLAPPLRQGFAEPQTAGFAGFATRAAVACGLDALAAEYEAGTATEEELYRHLRGCLYVLDAGELLRVGECVAALVRRNDDGAGTGGAGEADARRASRLLQGPESDGIGDE